MSRTRKFQGVCLKTGKLIQGVSFLTYDPESKLAEPGKNVFLSDGYGHSHNVIPESVGDFTGMPDINGEELYEHDTVKLNGREYVIAFDNGCFCLALINKGVVLYLGGRMSDLLGAVKTGNIYLNYKEK